jgi:hypothetical protein
MQEQHAVLQDCGIQKDQIGSKQKEGHILYS